MLPSSLIKLSNWYLTLPIGSPGSPTLINDLSKYLNRDHFYVNETAKAVVFVAPVGGVTTKNSKYPRSELREMMNGQKADWSMTQGFHSMTAVESIHKVPKVKSVSHY
jgi:Alginate lyase